MSSATHPKRPPFPHSWFPSGTPATRKKSTTRVPRAAARADARLLPRKAPTQERSRATVEAVLAGAVRLFATHGYARTSTNQIARLAGVSVGSLYQYFPNKDAILAALLGRHMAEVERVIDESLVELLDPKRPLRDAVGRMLHRFVALHERDPLLTRAVEQQVGQMPRLPETRHHAEQEYVATLQRVLEGRREVRPGDRQLMARVLFEATETVVAWLAHGRAGDLDRQAALDEAVELICRYVER